MTAQTLGNKKTIDKSFSGERELKQDEDEDATSSYYFARILLVQLFQWFAR